MIDSSNPLLGQFDDVDDEVSDGDKQNDINC